MEDDEFPLLLKPYSADSLARALDVAFSTAVALPSNDRALAARV